MAAIDSAQRFSPPEDDAPMTALRSALADLLYRLGHRASAQQIFLQYFAPLKTSMAIFVSFRFDDSYMSININLAKGSEMERIIESELYLRLPWYCGIQLERLIYLSPPVQSQAASGTSRIIRKSTATTKLATEKPAFPA